MSQEKIYYLAIYFLPAFTTKPLYDLPTRWPDILYIVASLLDS